MESQFNPNLVGNVLLILLALLVVFHLLVIIGIVPYGIVWAGKINSRVHLLRMESISLVVLALAIVLVALRMKYLTFLNYPAVVNGGMWLLFAFFLLNTLGNLTAKSPIEKYGFGTLTIVMSLCCLVLAIS
ncbi:MAG: hypothetical protein WBA23_03500 [Tunicatimonas sp.]|uniref:hypothetical protein n=1 Tax=Tunicatimonas sp. TaxID=1940096 RepID=UPI003C7278EB